MFDSYFESEPEKLRGRPSRVALLGVVQEPGLVLQLLLGQISGKKFAFCSFYYFSIFIISFIPFHFQVSHFYPTDLKRTLPFSTSEV